MRISIWAKIITLTVIFTFGIQGKGMAEQCEAVASGSWGNAGTWSCAGGPGCGDTITIPAGITVDIKTTQDYLACADAMFIIVEGTLDFQSGKKLKLPAGSGVLVRDGGAITGGGGGGNSNVIEIGGTPVWDAAGGDVTTPTVMGEPYITEVISVASGNWSNTATWDCACVPDSLNDVTIEIGHSVTLDGSHTVSQFIINGSFISGGAHTLDVGGDWNNQGTFTTNGETIRFDGGVTQGIIGSVGQTFSSIAVIQGSSVTNSTGVLTLTGNLLFDNGTFNTANNLVLHSDANGTANIGDLTTGTFSGNVIYNRHIPSGATHWRFFSSALSGQTIDDWNDDFITAGFTGSDYPTFGFASIQTYDEAFVGHKDSGYAPVSSVAQSLNAGQGFWVWAGDASAGTAAFTVDLIGSINQGAVNMPVSFTSSGDIAMDGWNMVGNPYPCAIDWDAAGWTKTNIDDAVYIWDPNSGSYSSYVGGVGNNGGSGIIASGQAFWVKANAAGPTLTVQENVKSTSLSDPFKAASDNHVLRMTIYNADSSERDETTFNLKHGSSFNYDRQYDASKIILKDDVYLPNALFLASSSQEGEYLSINAFPYTEDFEIPIYVEVPSTGVYHFSFDDLGALPEVSCLFLRDEVTQQLKPISDASVISAGVLASDELVHRFTLIGGARSDISVKQPTCSQSKDGIIEVVAKGTGNWSASLSDVTGNEVQSISNSSENYFLFSGVESGEYLIAVTSGSACANREELVMVVGDETVAMFNTSVIEIFTDEDAPVNLINESSNADSYYWDFGNGDVSEEVYPQYSYDLPGDYVVSLIAYNSAGCSDTTYKKVFVIDKPINGSIVVGAVAYPNPTKKGDDLIIDFSDKVGDVEVTCFSVDGKVLYAQKHFVANDWMKLNTSTFAEGIVLLRVEVNNEILLFKLGVE